MIPNRFLPIAFCMTHCGKSLLWVGTDALSLYILIKIVGIPPLLAGTLFVLSSFWNAAVDGLWGHLVDHMSAIRRVLPGLCGVTSILACLTFASLPILPFGSGWAAAVALILFRTAFALFDVPHNATAALLADMKGHLRVARWRTMLSAAMTVLIGIVAMPLMSVDHHDAVDAAILFCALAFLALMLLAPLPWLIRATDQCAAPPPSRRRASRFRMPAGELIAFCFIQMLGFAALASIGKSVLHVDAMPPKVLEYALVMLSILRLVGIWLWTPVARRIGVSGALVSAYVVSACAVLMFPSAIAFGPLYCTFVLCLIGVSFGGVVLLSWSSFSERFARKGEGDDQAYIASSYGMFTAVSKIGLGLSGFLTGAWVSQQGIGLSTQALWPMAALVAVICLITAFLNGYVWSDRVKPMWLKMG